MPVQISSCVILALKKESNDEINYDKWEFRNSIKRRLGKLLEEFGINYDEARLFELKNYNAERWMDDYGVDVKNYIDDYYILVSETSYYDSGGDWEGPPPDDESLSKDPFFQFFHKKFTNDDEYVQLLEDKFILISSMLDQP